MGNEVYANNMEVSCKAASGKAICAFPDPCFTPPQTPATPPGVPIPYPNTGMASDATDGSKTVQISGQEVMLKNKSYFKRSSGDEAGCAPKKGVMTSTNMGKVFFNSWSMDVKFEGENVVRHLDLTTHNHSSVPGNTPTWPYLDSMSTALDHPCVADMKKEYDACKEYKPHGKKNPCPPHKPPKAPQRPRGISKDAFKRTKGYKNYLNRRTKYFEDMAEKNKKNGCLQARKCMLVPYKPQGRGKTRQPGCCPGQTGHHLVDVSSFLKPGTRKTGGKPRPGCSKYNQNRAPCVCAEGPDNTTATHGLMHTYQGVRAKQKAPQGKWKYEEAKKTGAAAHNMVFRAGCNQACLEAQLDAYHNQAGITDEKEIAASPSGRTDSEAAEEAWKEYDAMSTKAASIAGKGFIG